MNAYQKALQFIHQEKQFHLGFLPTEQSNPKTVSLEEDFRRSSIDGVATLQRPDRDVLDKVKKVYLSEEFHVLCGKMEQTLKSGGKIVFSGCGATGRLSILLESMWRTACRDTGLLAEHADQVYSIMTGGDFALVKSVEFFEDYAVFGRRQVQDLGMKAGDMLVAITEGGETSSVLGTVAECAERGCSVFLLFNNPADILKEKPERSRDAIADPRVTVLDLYCGPMALAGSTRLQATTSEQLVAGGALETVFCRLAGLPQNDYAAEFENLLSLLESEKIRRTMAEYIDFETDIYKHHGKITYFTHEYLLDVFTDTTERSPTFMLPPFRGVNDTGSPQSWAFVKDPLYSTPDAWKQAMARDLRCIPWTMTDYETMGVSDRISAAPSIGKEDLLAFRIGNENAAERFQNKHDKAVMIFADQNDSFPVPDSAVTLSFTASVPADFSFPFPEAKNRLQSPLRLMEHMAVKLVLNTISTGVMTKYGRVSGNWMSYVALSNKKLIDRGIRLVAELGKLSYEDAAVRIFQAMEDTEKLRSEQGEKICAVQYALKQMPER